MKFMILGLSLVVSLLSGCATIFSGGGQQAMTFKSVPDAAVVSIVDRDGVNVHTGATPETIKLKTGSSYFKPQMYSVTISKPGFQSRTIEIRPSINGWYFANVLIGGALGMLIVDPLTGAMYRLSPSHIDATLTRGTADRRSGDESLTILLAQDVPADLMSHAQLIK